MNLSSLSVNRPVFTSMITLLVIVLGAISAWRLPVDLMPDISMPRVSISTSYADASPEEIEELITRPIEEAVSAIPGVEEISSDSSEGNSRVSISFVWGTDLEAAANDIRDRLDRIIARLPDDADRPALRKFNPSDFPILILGVSSDLDPTMLRLLIDRQVKFRLERIDGVASLDVRGGNEREIHVDLDPYKIKAMNISLNTILNRIKAANKNIPAGSIHKANMNLRLRTPGSFNNLEDISNTVIAMFDNTPVRVKDIGTVKDSWVEKTSYVMINGKPGIQLTVQKQSGANTVGVAKKVLHEIENINRDFSKINIIPVIDTSQFIENSINNLGTSTIYGGMLAVIVLLVFLRNIRSTIIVAVAIPVSVIATFMLIYFKGFTLNIMTIGGLALGVGMLVDNAIVVVENILRIRDSGKSRVKAALLGSSEVTSAVIASTMTTLVVFLPLIFMRGMIGLMFQQLAYVVGFSLLCSLVAAISLVPMLCSKILKATKNNNLTIKNSENHSLLNRLFGITEKIFISIENAYKNLLELCLKNRIKVIIICFLILFFSGLLIPYIGTELNPEVDENEIRLTCEMEVGTRVEMVLEKCAYVHKILEKTVPELRCYQSYIGGTPWRPGDSSRAQIRVSLIPRAERKRSDVQIAEALTKAFEKIPGMTIRVRRGQGLFIMNMATRGMERIGIEVRGHDFETSGAIAQQIEQLIQDIPGITDIRLSRTAGTPEELLLIDREKAEELNLSIQQIGEALKTAVSGSRAGQYKDDGDEFNILVKMNEAKSLSLHEVLDLTVSNTKGVPVALRNVISSQTGTGPVVIERTDQERIVDLRVNIRGRDLGSIIADIREKIKDIVIPKNYYINFSGSYEEQQKAFLELTFSFILAVLLVYMVMASQFESLLDPLVVMFSLPFASIGVILTLFLTDTTLNMQSFIGCIMLAGIVVNNAILLVDYTNLLRTREELDLGDAIAEAGRRRLRPILMTALTTSLALIPLGLGLGEGGEAQAPMARAVIGGLLSSTLVTLVIIPVVYSLTERFRKSKKGYQDVQ